MSFGEVNYDYEVHRGTISLDVEQFWKNYEMQLSGGVRIYYLTFYIEEFNYPLDDLDKKIEESIEKEGYTYDKEFEEYPIEELNSILLHFKSKDYKIINEVSVQYNGKYLLTTFYMEHDIYVLGEGEISFDKLYGERSINTALSETSKINNIVVECIKDEFDEKLEKDVGWGMAYSPTFIYSKYFRIKKKGTNESTNWISNYTQDYEIENKFNDDVLSFFKVENDRNYVIKHFFYNQDETYPYYYFTRNPLSTQPLRVVIISDQPNEIDIEKIFHMKAKIMSDFFNDYGTILEQKDSLEKINNMYYNILDVSENITDNNYAYSLANLNEYSYNLDEFQSKKDDYEKTAYFFGMNRIIEKAEEYYAQQRGLIQKIYDRHLIAKNYSDSKIIKENLKITQDSLQVTRESLETAKNNLNLTWWILGLNIVLLIATIIVTIYHEEIKNCLSNIWRCKKK